MTALPSSFESETVISGIRATDIFTLNTALGATIEDQVVATLNGMRATWDPAGEYKSYRFVRQSQTFPDVLLKKRLPAGEDDVLFGIELKGWYLLAKERVPSLRFCTDPDACAPPDLVAVVPWALSNVLSGTPIAFDPWSELARYAAEYRNYHWAYVREIGKNGSPKINRPSDPRPYPKKADHVADSAVVDAGNFGRLARTGIMDDYIASAMREEICGVPAPVWINFFQSVEKAPTQAPHMVPMGLPEAE